jgi:hypothetical protein
MCKRTLTACCACPFLSLCSLVFTRVCAWVGGVVGGVVGGCVGVCRCAVQQEGGGHPPMWMCMSAGRRLFDVSKSVSSACHLCAQV